MESVTDVTQYLKDAENSLRDFITYVLKAKYGDGWEYKCGVKEETVRKWEERKMSEESRQASGTVDERLIYYAEFYDLETILERNWPGAFFEAFGEWKEFKVLLTLLQRYRDPDAHRRPLLPHQKSMIIGVSGEIRSRLVRYRSKKETTDDFFPRIESFRDGLGNIIVDDNSSFKTKVTHQCLRVGDTLEFVVTASDPDGGELEYCLRKGLRDPYKWQRSNMFIVNIDNEDVSKIFKVEVRIRGKKDYHAHLNFDDSASFIYSVLPKRSKS